MHTNAKYLSKTRVQISNFKRCASPPQAPPASREALRCLTHERIHAIWIALTGNIHWISPVSRRKARKIDGRHPDDVIYDAKRWLSCLQPTRSASWSIVYQQSLYHLSTWFGHELSFLCWYPSLSVLLNNPKVLDRPSSALIGLPCMVRPAYRLVHLMAEGSVYPNAIVWCFLSSWFSLYLISCFKIGITSLSTNVPPKVGLTHARPQHSVEAWESILYLRIGSNLRASDVRIEVNASIAKSVFFPKFVYDVERFVLGACIAQRCERSLSSRKQQRRSVLMR